MGTRGGGGGPTFAAEVQRPGGKRGRRTSHLPTFTLPRYLGKVLPCRHGYIRPLLLRRQSSCVMHAWGPSDRWAVGLRAAFWALRHKATAGLATERPVAAASPGWLQARVGADLCWVCRLPKKRGLFCSRRCAIAARAAVGSAATFTAARRGRRSRPVEPPCMLGCARAWVARPSQCDSSHACARCDCRRTELGVGQPAGVISYLQ